MGYEKENIRLFVYIDWMNAEELTRDKNENFFNLDFIKI